MEDKKMIQFFGIIPTRSLLRFVEAKIKKWIERELIYRDCPKNLTYHIQVERDETFPYYECAAEVQIDSHEWRGHGSGRTLHEALNRALKHLKSANVLPLQSHNHRAAIENVVA